MRGDGGVLGRMREARRGGKGERRMTRRGRGKSKEER